MTTTTEMRAAGFEPVAVATADARAILAALDQMDAPYWGAGHLDPAATDPWAGRFHSAGAIAHQTTETIAAVLRQILARADGASTVTLHPDLAAHTTSLAGTWLADAGHDQPAADPYHRLAATVRARGLVHGPHDDPAPYQSELGPPNRFTVWRWLHGDPPAHPLHTGLTDDELAAAARYRSETGAAADLLANVSADVLRDQARWPVTPAPRDLDHVPPLAYVADYCTVLLDDWQSDLADLARGLLGDNGRLSPAAGRLLLAEQAALADATSRFYRSLVAAGATA
jgi:hypothetical protein